MLALQEYLILGPISLIPKGTAYIFVPHRVHCSEEQQKKLTFEREVQDIVGIFSFTDHNQNASGNKMIAGSVAELIGKHMKFDSNDNKLGIFFIAADESETRVSVYVKNTDNTQIFQIPSMLQKGEYTMVLRCIPHNFKKIQICKFKKTLIVE